MVIQRGTRTAAPKITTDYDVAIIGGGLAGGTLARQLVLKAPELRIVIIERDTFPCPAAVHKVGESTVELGAHYLAETLQLRSYFESSQLRKFGIRCFFDAPKESSFDNRLEIGGSSYFSIPTYQIDRGHLENHLRQLAVDAGITFIEKAKVGACEFQTDRGNVLNYTKDGASHSCTAGWIIDASGRWAVLKKQLGLALSFDHDCSSAWFRFDAKIDIDTWMVPRGDPFGKLERSRWYSTNHLMGAGYWVWLIPLRDDRTSVGIVYDEGIHKPTSFNSYEHCLAWLEQHEPACAQACREYSDTLMDFKVMRKYTHDCKRVFSSDGWGLTGEAGVFLDPFYSPGTDYIAFSNTMLADLIIRSARGENVVRRTELYNAVYKALYSNAMVTYRGQYAMFGNPLVMPMKIVWDYILYWSFIAPLFFFDIITDIDALTRIQPFVGDIEELNRGMQDLFRQWDQLERPKSGKGALDNTACSFLYNLNAALVSNYRPAGPEIGTFMARAIQTLREVAHEIASYSGIAAPSVVGDERQPAITAELRPFLENIRKCAYA